MPKIFLVNVGANTADQGRARSPLFDNGSFLYVSFPFDGSGSSYPPEVHPYVSDPAKLRTHLDPDWHNLTYGDFCHNRRARALLSAEVDDILLFWGLLWRVRDKNGDVWQTNERKWCLLGAMRIAAILKSSQAVQHLSGEQQRQVADNEHMRGGRVESRPLVRVFLAERKHSYRFRRAVDLEIYDDRGLLRRTITAKDGRLLEWHRSPRWNSALRPCRAIFDLSIADQRRRAIAMNQRVQSLNPQFDILAGLVDC